VHLRHKHTVILLFYKIDKRNKTFINKRYNNKVSKLDRIAVDIHVLYNLLDMRNRQRLVEHILLLKSVLIDFDGFIERFFSYNVIYVIYNGYQCLKKRLIKLSAACTGGKQLKKVKIVCGL